MRLPDRRIVLATDVSDVHGLSPFNAAVKSTLVGKMGLTVRRCRRAPMIALRSRRADRADRSRLPPPDARRSFRTVYVVPVGPGEWPVLRDTIESILHYEGADAKVVVADDDSVDSRAAVVRAAFPQVDVIRSRWPSCGAWRIFPMLARTIRICLERYDFEVLGKVDTDALMTGPGLGRHAIERFRADPSLGMIGTYRVRGDGVPEDYSLDRWLLSHQLRYSLALRDIVDAARSSGYDGEKCVGGLYLLSRELLEAADRSGLLRRRLPWWLVLSEDTRFSLVTLACGFRLGSIGGPGEPTMVGLNNLPMPKEDVLREGKLAVHSTRRGMEDETEDELRAYFRAIRETDAPARGPGP